MMAAVQGLSLAIVLSILVWVAIALLARLVWGWL